jgi:branched-chain amino acid transport system permease protein
MGIGKATSKDILAMGLGLLILALSAAAPLYASVYMVVMLTSVLMYVTIAVSWTLFSGPTGYISLASAAFFGAGIYTAAVSGNALPLPLVIVLGGVVGFCLAILVGALTLRLRGI